MFLIAHRDRADRSLSCLFDRQFETARGGDVAERALAVENRRGRRLGHNLGLAFGHDQTVANARDIDRNVTHTVRIVADQIRLDHQMGDLACPVGRKSRRHEGRVAHVPQIIRAKSRHSGLPPVEYYAPV